MTFRIAERSKFINYWIRQAASLYDSVGSWDRTNSSKTNTPSITMRHTGIITISYNRSMISESLPTLACEAMLSTAPFAESLALDSWNGPATANKIHQNTTSAWSLKRQQHVVGLATKHTKIKIAQMPTIKLVLSCSICYCIYFWSDPFLKS